MPTLIPLGSPRRILENEFRRELIRSGKKFQKGFGISRYLFDNFFTGPGAVVQTVTFFVISFNQVFNFPENHFHEYGLRANPSTKYSAENNRK